MDHPPPTRELQPSALTANEMYLLLRDSVMPRPIAWVSTIGTDGRSNLAPYSFFSVCSSEPPILGFSAMKSGRDARGQPTYQDTMVNVRANGEMVINDVPESMMLPMVETSANLPPGESEFDFAKPLGCSSIQSRSTRFASRP